MSHQPSFWTGFKRGYAQAGLLIAWAVYYGLIGAALLALWCLLWVAIGVLS